ncbi:MAG: GIY-YIG nuclease family protein [Ignavibacteriaceae bacterium]
MAEWLSSQSEIPLCGKCGGLEMFTVYILKSIKNSRFYIGHTADPRKRLIEHNSGKTRSTKAYAPWEIVYTEDFGTKSKAYRREMEIKSYKSGFKFKELQKSERWQSG